MDLCSDSELFELLVKNAHGFAIFTLDDQGRVASWNESAEKLLGYKAEEIMGESVDRFFTPEDRERGEPRKELSTAARVGQASDDRWILKKDGDRFWCSGLTIALKDSDLRGYAKVMRDQTIMKQALDEVQRLNRELRETIQQLHAAQASVQERIQELEKFEEVVVNRELDMVKVKRQLKDAEQELERLRDTKRER